MITNKVILSTGEIVDSSQLKLGDLLLGPNGNFSTVSNIEIVEDEIFQIETKMGSPFYVNEKNVLRNKQYPTIEELKIGNLDKAKLDEMKITRSEFVCFDNSCNLAPLEIDAYSFGVILMNSSISNGSVRLSLPKGSYMREIIKTSLLPKLDMQITRDLNEKDANNNSVYVGNSVNEMHPRREKNRLIQILDKLELSDVIVRNRFIPDCYKYGTPEDRAKLLAAIIDCSACVNGSGFQITSASKRLASDLVFLARSLGLNSTTRETVKAGKAYQLVNFGGDMKKIPLHNKNNNVGKDIISRPFEYKPIGAHEFVQITATGNYLLQDFTIIR